MVIVNLKIMHRPIIGSNVDLDYLPSLALSFKLCGASK
jgi:hypothetical protein